MVEEEEGRGKSGQGPRVYYLSKEKGEEASWKGFSQLFAILASSGEWNAWGM